MLAALSSFLPLNMPLKILPFRVHLISPLQSFFKCLFYYLLVYAHCAPCGRSIDLLKLLLNFLDLFYLEEKLWIIPWANAVNARGKGEECKNNTFILFIYMLASGTQAWQTVVKVNGDKMTHMSCKDGCSHRTNL